MTPMTAEELHRLRYKAVNEFRATIKAESQSRFSGDQEIRDGWTADVLETLNSIGDYTLARHQWSMEQSGFTIIRTSELQSLKEDLETANEGLRYWSNR